nr:hypothetical protein [Tanacetum cinerariifolium]
MKGVRGRVRGSRKDWKFAQKDVISTMPEEVITNILHCLPLQDAVQTSILSKDWKFKWTMMPNSYLMRSSMRIKEFTFQNMRAEVLELTTHLFSCLELTHLELDRCEFYPPSEFGGFPNLLQSLDVSCVSFGSSKCKEFITRSLLLEILKVGYDDTEKVKQIDIAKLIIDEYVVRVPAVCSSPVDFSRMGQLQLLKVKLAEIRGLKREVRLVKYLLDCSPLLKKMDIYADSSGVRELGGDNGERKFATKLLKLRRASPLAKVDIVWR